MPIHRPIQDGQVDSSAMMNCTLDHDGPQFPWVDWTEPLISLSSRHDYGLGRTRTHRWRCRVSSDDGPSLGASDPTHDDAPYAPKSVLDNWHDAATARKKASSDQVALLSNKTIYRKTCFGKFHGMTMLTISRESRKKILFKTQIVMSGLSALGSTSKMTAPALFFFEGARHLYKKRWKLQNQSTGEIDTSSFRNQIQYYGYCIPLDIT